MREMKDSGVEWIGKIPAGWSISRIKYVAEFDPVCNKSAINGSSPITYTPMDCIKHGWFINNSAPLESLSTSLTTYQEGDIVMAKVTPCFENGNIAIMEGLHNGFGMGSSELFVFRPKSIDTKFFFYWLQNNAFVQKAKATMTGTGGLKRVSPVFTRNCPIHIPPYKDQNRIALYLDGKLAQVNILIANVQAQIEKLKAYKQSVITEVVTKGLDPTMPMKDSGVEWIREIPAHWKIKRGKALFKESEARSTDGSEELLTVSQYTGITPRSQKNVTMFEALSLEGYKICEIGDIAANTMWLWAGAIGVSEYRGVISPSYNVYRQRGNDFIPRYLDHLLRAPMLVQEYASLSTGIRSSRLRLYPKDFLNIMFPVPPIEEQQAMLDALSSKFSAVDRLIAIKEAKIEKLEQYKKSLIYEYVTGKREIGE